jgi:hypothetical protein
MDLVGLGSGQAEAAPWVDVAKILRRLGPQYYRALSKADKKALEVLTERYPAVRGVDVESVRGTAIEDLLKTSSWQPPFMAPTMGEWVEQLPTDYKYRNYGTIKLKPMYYDSIADPAMEYGHEASHVFSGPLFDWAAPLRKDRVLGAQVDRPPRATMEGFAEGASHGLLNRYNTGYSGAPYWKSNYKNSPNILREPYLKAGRLGVDVGQALRGGENVNQREIIDLLMSIVKQYQ